MTTDGRARDPSGSVPGRDARRRPHAAAASRRVVAGASAAAALSLMGAMAASLHRPTPVVPTVPAPAPAPPAIAPVSLRGQVTGPTVPAPPVRRGRATPVAASRSS